MLSGASPFCWGKPKRGIWAISRNAKLKSEMSITLKWLTLADIKAQCRIEPNDTLEDTLLTRYGAAAEQALLNACNRTYESLIEQYAEVPSDLYVAGLMLTTHLYEHRGPTSNVSLSVIPYMLDMFWKPYAILAGQKPKED